jgi:transcriptional regulator with XRE-family HTH domain
MYLLCMSIGEIVKQKREALDLTQDELAEKAGVHRNSVANLERAQDPNVEVGTLKKLAAILRMDVAEFFPKRRHRVA